MTSCVRTLLAVGVAWAVFVCRAWGQSPSVSVATNSAMVGPVDVSGTNQVAWFRPGEKLVYKLYWGIIPVGMAEFRVDWTEVDGRRMVLLRATARTTSVVAKIYPVDDYVESTVDPKTFLPVKYVQRLNEGRHHRDDLITFDHAAKKARWVPGSKDKPGKDITIDVDTRDVLTMAYFLRSQGLREGENAKYRVVVDDKVYDLQLAGQSYEEISAGNLGSVRCLRVEPQAKFGAIFVRKGKVMLWFTDDAQRICTRMTGRVSVASVKAILVDAVLPPVP